MNLTSAWDRTAPVEARKMQMWPQRHRRNNRRPQMWFLRCRRDRQPIFRLGPHRRAPAPPEAHNGNPPLTLSGKSREAADVAPAALEEP